MRRLSIGFLNHVLVLVLCVWCYCFGNKRAKRKRDKNNKKVYGSDVKNSERKASGQKVQKISGASDSTDKVVEHKLSLERNKLDKIEQSPVLAKCQMQKGYVNPDFYVPFIDSETDLSSSSLSLTRIKKSVVENKTLLNREKFIPSNGSPVISAVEKPTTVTPPSGGRENKSFCADNDVVVEVHNKKSYKENRSSVKSSDFNEVLETARKNEEEIVNVRNSYYEKLSEAVVTVVPISVHDDLLAETVNFRSVTEELKNVGNRYLSEKQQVDIGEKNNVHDRDTTRINFLIPPKSESPDSGMESAQNSTNILVDKLLVITNTDATPQKLSSPGNFNSKSSECLPRLPDKSADNNNSQQIVKWSSAAEVMPRNESAKFLNSANGDFADKKQQVVTTTIVHTATTTLTQVSKRFSDSWKEFEVKTTRRRSSGSQRSTSSVCSDDMKDLHITVNSEQGEPKSTVDGTSRVIGQPRDHRVTSEYLTNLSHMLTAPDDCAKFHKDSCHGSLASISSVEISKQLNGEPYQQTLLGALPKLNLEPATPCVDDDKSLSSVIASIANSLLQCREYPATDLNCNKIDQQVPRQNIDEQVPRFATQIGTTLDAMNPVVCCHDNCTASSCSTLIINLKLSPSNLTEYKKASHSPLAKINTCLDKQMKSSPKTTCSDAEENKYYKISDSGKELQKFVAVENQANLKSPKGVLIENVVHETTTLCKESPEGSVYDNVDNIDNEEEYVEEDINARRAREAAAFAQRFFQYGYKVQYIVSP